MTQWIEDIKALVETFSWIQILAPVLQNCIGPKNFNTQFFYGKNIYKNV